MVEPSVFVAIVKLQRRLLTGVFLLHPKFAGARWLVDSPFKAELRLDSELWEVTRHGVGLEFKRREPAPNVVVDVHVGIDNPNLLNAWRLQQFVESSGGKLGFDEAEAMLQNSAHSGVLVRRSNGYELRS